MLLLWLCPYFVFFFFLFLILNTNLCLWLFCLFSYPNFILANSLLQNLSKPHSDLGLCTSQLSSNISVILINLMVLLLRNSCDGPGLPWLWMNLNPFILNFVLLQQCACFLFKYIYIYVFVSLHIERKQELRLLLQHKALLFWKDCGYQVMLITRNPRTSCLITLLKFTFSTVSRPVGS